MNVNKNKSFGDKRVSLLYDQIIERPDIHERYSFFGFKIFIFLDITQCGMHVLYWLLVHITNVTLIFIGQNMH